MLALNRMGVEVAGYEYNPALVELGRKLLEEDGCPPSLYVSDANVYPASCEQSDAHAVGIAE
jgi:hypothetical protein